MNLLQLSSTEIITVTRYPLCLLNKCKPDTFCVPSILVSSCEITSHSCFKYFYIFTLWSPAFTYHLSTKFRPPSLHSHTFTWVYPPDPSPPAHPPTILVLAGKVRSLVARKHRSVPWRIQEDCCCRVLLPRIERCCLLGGCGDHGRSGVAMLWGGDVVWWCAVEFGVVLWRCCDVEFGVML